MKKQLLLPAVMVTALFAHDAQAHKQHKPALSCVKRPYTTRCVHASAANNQVVIKHRHERYYKEQYSWP